MSLLSGERNLMLKKKLCQKCWEKVIRDRGMKWTYSEEWWKEKVIMLCPLQYREKGETGWRSMTEQPPTKCPFLIEHILSKED